MALSKINIAVNNTGAAKPAIKTAGGASSKIAEQAESVGSGKKGLISNNDSDFAKAESQVAELLGRPLTKEEGEQLAKKLASQSSKFSAQDAKALVEDLTKQAATETWKGRFPNLVSNPDELIQKNDAKSVAKNFGLESPSSSGASSTAPSPQGNFPPGAVPGAQGGVGAGGINISQTQSQMQIQDSSPIQQMRIEQPGINNQPYSQNYNGTTGGYDKYNESRNVITEEVPIGF